MSEYENYLKKLKSFCDGLDTTGIKFLYFLASDINQPNISKNINKAKVKENLKVFTVNGHKFHICPGVSNNYWYIFCESHIKYILTSHNPKFKLDHAGDINHGDHMDFAIYRTRTNAIIVKSHKTTYVDMIGDLSFVRNTDECNFTLQPDIIKSFDSFISMTKCEDMIGNFKPSTLETTYSNINDRLIVFSLCQNMIQIGGKKRKYLKKKKYKRIMKGGIITFFSETFIEFLLSTLIRPLYKKRDDLRTIQILYDEESYFGSGKDTNLNIVIMYDFENFTRNIFYIDTKIALNACYVDYQMQNNGILFENFSQDEKNCYTAYRTQYMTLSYI